MKTFPVMLDVRGRRAVLVGGGPVGRRKARALLEAGADVTIIDPTGETVEGAHVAAEAYAPEQLDGAALVFACTDDAATNTRIAADARARGALVNAADQPEDCDFHLPAVAREGDVVVAVGTGGAAPGLAGLLRDFLAEALPDRIGEFAAALATVRDELRERVPHVERRMSIMKRLTDEATYRAFATGGVAAVRDRLAELLGEG